MNVFPWIFAEIKDAKRVYLKFVKYLIKGKMLKINSENYKDKDNELLANDEEENLNKKGNDLTYLTSNKYSENILLKISDVTIKYNANANSIDNFNFIDDKNIEKNKLSIQSMNENFNLSIDKLNELNIEKGEIVIIYGNNASGKSLLLKAILDYCIDESEVVHDHKHSETMILTNIENYSNIENSKLLFSSDKSILKNSDRIYVKNTNISYVPQELWTFSATLYENITFKCNEINNNLKNRDMTEDKKQNQFKKRFEEVLKKCELIRDIESFPEKEFKIINFKGSNISGGQKQRINIARAAFNYESELLLFDNCLSSIDSNIANLIFDNLFQQLKREGKGIVLVTSDKKWLKNADKIYFIEKNKLIKKDKLNFKGFFNSNNSLNSNLLKEDTAKNDSKENFTNKGSTENIKELKNFDTGDRKDEEKDSRINENEYNNKIEDLNSIIIKADENPGNVFISYKTLIFFFSKAGYLMFLITVLFLTFMQLGRNFIELFLADWLKNDKADLDTKLALQRTNMRYYLLFVIMHTIATIGRSAFFAINFLNAAEKIYKITIEKFIFSKIKCLQKFNIGYLTNL